MSQIVKATPGEAELVLKILLECADWLADNGLMHWKKANFSIQTVSNSLEKDDVFLLFNSGEPLGTITISQNRPEYYVGFPQSWTGNNAFYLKKLAVRPSYHSKGFATELLKFADNKVRERGADALRLDSIKWKSRDLTEFYTKRGFRICGSGVTKGGNTINFFEKKLT